VPELEYILGDSTPKLLVHDKAFAPQAAELARRDRTLQLMPRHHHSFGHSQAIVIDGPNLWRAAADPRSDGSAEYVT